jgi:hypothetical protein
MGPDAGTPEVCKGLQGRMLGRCWWLRQLSGAKVAVVGKVLTYSLTAP